MIDQFKVFVFTIVFVFVILVFFVHIIICTCITYFLFICFCFYICTGCFLVIFRAKKIKKKHAVQCTITRWVDGETKSASTTRNNKHSRLQNSSEGEGRGCARESSRNWVVHQKIPQQRCCTWFCWGEQTASCFLRIFVIQMMLSEKLSLADTPAFFKFINIKKIFF